MSAVFYNDNDAYCAQWLRNLIEAGHLPAGDVDGRSIVDVRPGDLVGYRECHFFAGIGGWPLALRIAGYEGSVWTGSCPCQPFSAAGKQGGSADERHLWPHWFRLIRECRPDTIFGEQVEGAVGFGWIDRVFADLEAEDYACGAAILGAHSVGAPHIRQRLFWVADATGKRQRPDQPQPSVGIGTEARSAQSAHPGAYGWMGNAEGAGCRQRMPHAEGGLEGSEEGASERIGAGSGVGWLGDAESEQVGRTGQPWQDSVWLPCLDGKARRIEPTIFPLAHAGEWGAGSRMGILRGAGNAIVPALAAAFVSAFLEIIEKSEERDDR